MVFDLETLPYTCMKPSYTTIRGITHNLDHPTMPQTRVGLRYGHVRTISTKPADSLQRRTPRLQRVFARRITAYVPPVDVKRASYARRRCLRLFDVLRCRITSSDRRQGHMVAEQDVQI